MITLTKFQGGTIATNLDRADVVCLILAMSRTVAPDGDNFISADYVRVYSVAHDAALALHAYTVDEGDDWDGTVWIEELESHGADSLAYRLARDCVRDELGALPVVAKWLNEQKLLAQGVRFQ
jgi:hypothetical protein